MKILLMVTCLGDVLRPGAGQATVRLLRRLGHEVDFPQAQTCCGQPLYNSGFLDLARMQARYTIEAFGGDHPVVTPSGSCAAMLKVEYPHLFPPDDPWHRRAKELAARTFELSDFLVNQLGVLDVGARYVGRVTYHYACHLRALGLTDEPTCRLRGKISAAGLEAHFRSAIRRSPPPLWTTSCVARWQRRPTRWSRRIPVV
jgi:L-lactate dehydrogenase complex protein LldE